MIHVDRGNPPPGFDLIAQGWWNKWEVFKARNPTSTPSNFWSTVRSSKEMQREYAPALKAAFAGKCAFCESQMEHVSPAHIEHYRPKGKKDFVHLMFDWDNWLLSCPRCNTKKRDQFPDCAGEPCLINPAEEPDPGAHLDFVGAQVCRKTERGKKTIKLVGLDRSKLEENRGKWLSDIDKLLLLVMVPEVRAEARELLIWAKQDDAQYAAMTRCYLQEKQPEFAQTEHPRATPNEPIERIRALVDLHQAQIAALLQ